jgi:hypothetical protein
VSFTVSDFSDFKQLLALHPEWQVELRRMIVGNDLEALPALVRDLVEAQRSADERLTRLETAVHELRESVFVLQQSIGELVELQRRNEQRLSQIEGKLGEHGGWILEMRFRDRAAAYMGRWLRRTKVVDFNDLIEEAESHLTAEETDELLNIDVVLRGRPKGIPEGAELWLAVEVSSVVDREDVARAIHRAGLLRRTGHRVLPVVVGHDATDGGASQARLHNVVMLQDGKGLFWDEAVAKWIE